MHTSDTITRIAPALAAAQAGAEQVIKGGTNKYDNYRYARLEDYIDVVQKALAGNELALIVEVGSPTTLERQTKAGGTELAFQVLVTGRLIHGPSGEWIEGQGVGFGQDRSDKGLYKAITGARKYLLASLLNLGTIDDPENDEDEPQPPRDRQPQEERQPAKRSYTRQAKAPDAMTASEAAQKTEPASQPAQEKPKTEPAPQQELETQPTKEDWKPSKLLIEACDKAQKDPREWARIAMSFAKQRASLPADHEKEMWKYICRRARAMNFVWDGEAKVFTSKDDVPMDNSGGGETNGESESVI